MRRRIWLERVSKIMIGLLSGSTLIGTSCGSEVRNSITAAGLDFVQSTAGKFLEKFIPVDQVLGDP